tara:strand:- start:340 stop:612 length:273 start_codon:yes stop_codon:yes gene_type:complete
VIKLIKSYCKFTIETLGNLVDPQWWATLILKKTGLLRRCEKVGEKVIKWKSKFSPRQRLFIDVLTFTLIALVMEPLLNMVGYSMLPWRWF